MRKHNDSLLGNKVSETVMPATDWFPGEGVLMPDGTMNLKTSTSGQTASYMRKICVK